MATAQKIYINIHGHRRASSVEEWVLQNLLAKDFPPENMENGYYSVGFHPYSIGRVNEAETLKKVRLATKHPRVLAVGECGLDKAIDTNMEDQLRIFEQQVDMAEAADLPVVLHLVRAFNEMLEFMKAQRPQVPMIIHGYQGSAQMAGALVKAGFLLSFGEIIGREHSKTMEALSQVPVESLFLETDEGEQDIRELYHIAAGVKEIRVDQLREQIFENFMTHFRL